MRARRKRDPHPFDELLCAVGRIANTEGYGLEELGIELTRTRTVETDETLRTLHPTSTPAATSPAVSVHAYRFAPGLVRGGERALRRRQEIRADYSVIPWATFTEPEVARVG